MGDGSGSFRFQVRARSVPRRNLASAVRRGLWRRRIQAEVNLTGPQTVNATKRTFLLSITDLTHPNTWSQTVTTPGGVAIADIASQGGAIVEDQPACELVDFLSCNHLGGGLASFAKPVQFSRVSMLNDPDSSRAANYVRWVVRKNGHQLADTGQLQVANAGMNYTVSWLRKN